MSWIFSLLAQIAERQRQAQVEMQRQALEVMADANARRAAGARPAAASASPTAAARPAPAAPPVAIARPATPDLPPAEAAFATAGPSRARELLAPFSGGGPLLAGIVLAEALAPPVALRHSQLFDPQTR